MQGTPEEGSLVLCVQNNVLCKVKAKFRDR